MRKLVYYVGVSLDGYIAGPDGEVDFFPLADDLVTWIRTHYPETIPTHVRSLVGMTPDEPNRRFGALVMGRGTYQPALDIGVMSPYAHMEQYVVSGTLGRIDDSSVEVVEQDPVGLVRRLKQEATSDIWLCGGGTLAGTLFDEIDELILKSYPVLAGAGVPVISGDFRPAAFTPTQREVFSNGTQITWYRRD
ncbi:dihydrofolate reductase family protein [Phytoactinopolyspora halotolerans]|uniref:Dihydrofolate reductase n=1 Tax=Phytoactinopolyspora halotolerans TaxID=1981512 RepID=A0A6L9SE87_9ACTN|nr:dihydrofolate reductase family protein [Phytoactinopolyspora halotolerans]NEE03397.1 dihydrofolate reductase [Phytoactinopolyspora halotolerans]